MWGSRIPWVIVAAFLGGLWWTETPQARSACCYFTAKDKDILQPSQKVFITWDPKTKVETFTVQPRFEGNARDFGMVIPTPGQPKLDEMPRDFFKELAVYTIMKRREMPQSRLMFMGFLGGLAGIGGMMGMGGMGGGMMGIGGMGGGGFVPRPPPVKVLETGVVGSLDYKILTAERADGLYTWLKENKYPFAGDEAILDHYIKKQWVFTVMKIDTMQMKRDKDGSFTGDVTPTRFQFTSDKLIYPLKMTQRSVKDKTEALMYVQAPFKVDLPGDMTYQFQWVPMLQNARGWYNKGTFGSNDLPGKADDWLKAIDKDTPALLERGEELGVQFVSGQRPGADAKGHIPTTLEWAKLLTKQDIQLLRGESAYSEKAPNVDEGFTANDFKNFRKAAVGRRIIEKRLEVLAKKKPGGYLVREAPAKDVENLRILAGHLQAGQFLTKFRKIFRRDEMEEDLELVPARLGKAEDKSEYEEILPTSPP